VAISNVIAWPIAYFMMRAMLESYAFRTDMGIGTYVFAGLFTVIIVLLTISYQTRKAALANPVNSLRFE
jgi:putative ABC transport system permease protein